MSFPYVKKAHKKKQNKSVYCDQKDAANWAPKSSYRPRSEKRYLPSVHSSPSTYQSSRLRYRGATIVDQCSVALRSVPDRTRYRLPASLAVKAEEKHQRTKNARDHARTFHAPLKVCNFHARVLNQ